LLYSKVKFGSSRKGETELSSALSPKLGISGSCSDKIKRAIEGFSGNCGSMSSSLPLILSSRYNVYESFVSVQPEEVKCYSWITFLTLKISMFWKSCKNPKHLFSNNNLLPTPPSMPLDQ